LLRLGFADEPANSSGGLLIDGSLLFGGLDTRLPVAGAAFGVGDGNDENLVLPIEKDDKIGELLEQNPAGSMQVRAVTARRMGCARKG